MDSHVVAEGYEDSDVDLLQPNLLEEEESMKSYCLDNRLKPGTADDMYTGVIGSQRYFVRGDPIDWNTASHLVAGAFMEQYRFQTPEIDYVDGEIMISSEGDPPIPVDTNRRAFRRREALPNFLQRGKADPDSVGDSLFVHLAGGAHDIGGNTVLADETAYPIDFQTFGKRPRSTTLRKFLKHQENYAEKKFSDYGDRLGFNARPEELRRQVGQRSEEFNEDRFWKELNMRLEGVGENISESAERFAENTVEYVEELENIGAK
jgi:hypothetical protein